MNHDRDVLFGVAAGESGYIDRADLLAAVNDWRQHQDAQFGDFLVQTGRLSAEQREAVQRLVEGRQALGHATGRATPADPTTAARDGLEAQIRAVLAGNLDITLVSSAATIDAREGDRDDAPKAAAFAGTRRFRILRPHAVGGLGEVFIAHDQELNRQVALKRIRGRDIDTPANRARFMLEAEVTGGLEHPGIVPVYSLGTSDDGRPFYAMRFIHGQSLREAIKAYHSGATARTAGARWLELRQLLTRFIEVCNAVEYAHSRDVLHRDLKPENIMLGTYGETLVVDWGLAKTLDAATLSAEEEAPSNTPPSTAGASTPFGAATDRMETNSASTLPTNGNRAKPSPTQQSSVDASAFPRSIRSTTTPTQLGAALGTPGYMSPEQAGGRLHEIGPASDVYGLGATLYCLLTGKPPFDDSHLVRVLEQVQRGDFRRPREVDRQIPSALEAICLKAMSLQPAERYESPRALAADLERWLAEEPVSVYKPPWHERLWHWGRRHRRGVYAVAAVLMSVAIVSTTAALIVRSAKDTAERDRDKAKAALEAEQEAKSAARRAIDNYVAIVTGDEMLEDERVQPLRQRLLRDALTYYEDLIKKQGPAEPARRELADAMLRVGRINQETGSKQDALRAFERAVDLLKPLVDQNPTEQQYHADLAFAYRSVGILQGELSRPQEARESLNRAVEAQEALAGRSPDTVAYRRELATCYAQLADQEADLRDDKNAVAHAKRALGIRQELAQASPDDAGLAADVATSRQSLAIFHVKRELWPTARENFEEALRIRSDLYRRHPEIERYQFDLAATWNGLGTLDGHTGEFDRAASEFLEALAVRQRLAEDHPTVTEYQQMMSLTLKNLGYIKGNVKRWEESLDYMRRALAILQRLVRGNPEVDRFQILLGDTWYDVGTAQLELNRPEEALESFSQARDIKKRLRDAKPDRHAYRSALGAALENVASTLHVLGRNDEARTVYQQAIDEQRNALAALPDNVDYRRLLAQHYRGLAETERALDHPEAARQAESQAAEVER